jgi:hypothetical protein
MCRAELLADGPDVAVLALELEGRGTATIRRSGTLASAVAISSVKPSEKKS